MAEMTERAGPHASSTGHATAIAISQDTTVEPAALAGEGLPVTRGFSQVSRDWMDAQSCMELNTFNIVDL